MAGPLVGRRRAAAAGQQPKHEGWQREAGRSADVLTICGPPCCPFSHSWCSWTMGFMLTCRTICAAASARCGRWDPVGRHPDSNAVQTAWHAVVSLSRLLQLHVNLPPMSPRHAPAVGRNPAGRR